jgi:hypothetical protein
MFVRFKIGISGEWEIAGNYGCRWMPTLETGCVKKFGCNWFVVLT